VDILGPEWEPGWQKRFIDDTVLEGVEMHDRDKVLAESERLRIESNSKNQDNSTDQ
jgi:hypothetical protein